MNEVEKEIEALLEIIEINKMIAKQNAMIVQVLTMPHILVKGNSDD